MKQLSAKDYCICEEPSREKEKGRAGEGVQTGTIAKFICPKGHAALSRSLQFFDGAGEYGPA